MKCVNPSHLYAGTPQQNMDDKKRDGRMPNLKGGSNRFNVLLDEDKVREIRKRYEEGESSASLADVYGLHRNYVGLVINGRRWNWVK